MNDHSDHFFNGFGARKRHNSTLADRIRELYGQHTPTHFTIDNIITMAYLIEQLTQERDPIELVRFMDWATGRLLGRLEQLPGMPNESELFLTGLEAIQETSLKKYSKPFHQITVLQRKNIVKNIEKGALKDECWKGIPSDYFYKRFYTKLLHGLFAEKKEWLQIGILRTADPGELRRS